MSKPIRVLQVVTKMERNGYESRIMDIYRNLDRDKVQFDFYTHRNEKGDFDDEIEALGGRLYYNNAINPFHLIKYLKELDTFFSNHAYDIVHAHLNSYCAWVLFVAKKHGVKVRIAHSRNTGFDSSWKKIFKMASKLFINFPPTHRFACSQNAGIWLFGKAFLKSSNSKVIPNAFNCDAFGYRDELREKLRYELCLRNEIALVTVGRLSPQKNHKMVFSVFSSFIKKYPNSKLFLFGDGELKDQLHELVDRMKISEFVNFMGNKPDVCEYLNAMDVMIFPSLYEGFGTVVLEAQCNGLPVLASNVLPPETGVTDLIKYCSLEDSVDDWVKILEKMLALRERKNYCETLKKAGYDMKTNAVNMQNFYINSINL